MYRAGPSGPAAEACPPPVGPGPAALAPPVVREGRMPEGEGGRKGGRVGGEGGWEGGEGWRRRRRSY